MAKNDFVTKDFALYVVHYFASMLTWSKEDILGEIDRTIKEAKQEDVVKIVRCKDCRWWINETCTNVNGATGYISNGDWFCASGERRNIE